MGSSKVLRISAALIGAISAGADPAIRNGEGCTPRETANFYGDPNNVGGLLDTAIHHQRLATLAPRTETPGAGGGPAL